MMNRRKNQNAPIFPSLKWGGGRGGPNFSFELSKIVVTGVGYNICIVSQLLVICICIVYMYMYSESVASESAMHFGSR